MEEMEPLDICFGLDPETDRRSLAAFVRRFASPQVIETLAGRMEEREMTRLVAELTGVLRRHLSHDEYHRLFLGQ